MAKDVDKLMDDVFGIAEDDEDLDSADESIAEGAVESLHEMSLDEMSFDESLDQDESIDGDWHPMYKQITPSEIDKFT